MSKVKKAREINEMVRYTMWSVFRLREQYGIADRTTEVAEVEALFAKLDDADVTVDGDPEGIYSLFVDRCLDQVTIEGDRALLEALLDAAPARAETLTKI